MNAVALLFGSSHDGYTHPKSRSRDEKLGLEIRSLGSRTCDRPDLEKGLKSDQCYYIQNEVTSMGCSGIGEFVLAAEIGDRWWLQEQQQQRQVVQCSLPAVHLSPLAPQTLPS